MQNARIKSGKSGKPHDKYEWDLNLYPYYSQFIIQWQNDLLAQVMEPRKKYGQINIYNYINVTKVWETHFPLHT